MAEKTNSKKRSPTFPDFLHVIELGGCSSTNDFLKENLPTLESRLPLMVRADWQSAGRGRNRRGWFSPPHQGLYVSLAFILTRRPGLQLLPLVAGIGAIEALAEICAQPLDLKWPNDILCQGRKLAGILVESVVTGERVVAIVGIGVNLSQQSGDFPADLLNRACSLKMLDAVDDDATMVAARLAHRFFAWLTILEQGRTKAIVRAANRRSHFLTGRDIAFHGDRGVIRGRYGGIAADGGMILELPGGEKVIHYSGEIDPSGG